MKTAIIEVEQGELGYRAYVMVGDRMAYVTFCYRSETRAEVKAEKWAKAHGYEIEIVTL